ncbi:glycosyltransferase [Curtobacterium sp. CFBP9011]|uniref:glycosyltransferase n=1 Tax=Curtobacterium sp. CFBP9011 TaxID=3096530 RepID=UPI002A6A08F5|nr:glycosyltransferase [Curtobacterium sp. CFBP9011]MDY1005545.1 glycosyltransferase [Curtobacterium sp. CFBP9011]
MPGLIAHEWVAAHGGSENVAEAMSAVFPDAAIQTLWSDAPERFPGRTVHESWLAKTPLRRHKALALPFMSSAWTRVDTAPYDFVLASSHVFAHHVGGRDAMGSTPKFAYIHTPMRTVYAADQDSRGAGLLVKASASLVRTFDRRFVNGGVQYAANSDYIRRRIAQVWHQEARVLHPPVDTTFATAEPVGLEAGERELLASLPEGFLLGASRFVPYKRLDLVIATAEQLKRPVVIAGRGPELPALRAQADAATVPVWVVVGPSDAMLRELYRRASVFVFPAVEDFGIMPLEAMAVGTPVVVGAEGGAREGVEAVSGGVVSPSVEPVAFADAVRRAERLDTRNVAGHVEEQFGTERFARELRRWVSGG